MSKNKSVLFWNPELGVVPSVRPTVERLKLNDLGMPGEGLGDAHAFGSLIDCFAGEDEELRDEFKKTFRKFLMDGGHPCKLHPLAEQVDGPFVDFPSYRTPAEWAHEEFLSWFKEHRGKDDFMEPAGRRWNDHMGNLGLHLVEPTDHFDEEILKKNNGVAGYFAEDHFRFYCDNKVNPYRWVGPINDVQHHEQASLCCTIPCVEDTYEQSGAVLKGEKEGRYLLEYEMEIELEDLREEMKEQNIYDFYGVSELKEPLGFLSQTHYNAQHLIEGGELRGEKFSYGQKRFVDKWIQNRYVNPNLQVSLMVNFREREGRYRLAEFMLAEYNQKSIFFHDKDVSPDIDSGRDFNPFRVDGNGVIPTSHEGMNEHIVDGGCSGNFAWSRVAVDVYKDKQFAPDGPIVLDGGECWRWNGKGKQKRTLKGTIDITAYYQQSMKLKTFPGQKGYWGSRWVGFQGDVDDFNDENEQHGLEWLGLIFENHGPFRIDMTTSKFNLVQA